MVKLQGVVDSHYPHVFYFRLAAGRGRRVDRIGIVVHHHRDLRHAERRGEAVGVCGGEVELLGETPADEIGDAKPRGVAVAHLRHT